MNRYLYLASTSPRRQDILAKLGISFETLSPDVDESRSQSETPLEYVERLSVDKAFAGYNLLDEKSLTKSKSYPKQHSKSQSNVIIGGDVTVEIDGQEFAKPDNRDHAKEILMFFSGKTQWVREGYAIVLDGEVFSKGVASARLKFKNFDEKFVDQYLSDTNEWHDKAGAYAIQGEGIRFIDSVEGSYFDIVGLPIFKIAYDLKLLGFDIPETTISQIWKEDRAKLAHLLNSI